MTGDIGTTVLFMVLQWAITAVLGAVAGWCSAKWKTAKDKKEAEDHRIDALCDCMCDILGDKLDQQYEAYMNGEHFDNDRLEKVHTMYKNYAYCGGDGIRKAHTEHILGVSLDKKSESEKE